MKDEHIIKILEDAPLTSLSEGEIEVIRAHIELCHECRRAYEAAQISTLLIKERVAETIEPSPFFHTRIMAAIRERKLTPEISAFQRMWDAASSLVYSMAVVVAILVAMTLFSFGLQSDSATQELASSGNQYSAEDVILTQETLPDMTDEQVFTAISEP